jgi:hypothetical protein
MAAISYISRDEVDEAKNLIGQPNVLFARNTREHVTKTHRRLYEVLMPLVRTKPDWRFLVEDDYRGVATRFAVMHKEELGTVSIARKADRWRICVNNARINDALLRGESFWTSDPEKATMKIRQNFYRESPDERLSMYNNLGTNGVNKLFQDAVGVRTKHRETVSFDAWKFIRANIEAFSATLSEKSKEQAHAYMEAYETTRSISAFRDEWSKATADKKVMLVIQDEGQYIVKRGGDVSVYTNEMLTDDMKSKLGMLKLVEEGQLFPDIGYRISPDAFLITCADT